MPYSRCLLLLIVALFFSHCKSVQKHRCDSDLDCPIGYVCDPLSKKHDQRSPFFGCVVSNKAKVPSSATCSRQQEDQIVFDLINSIRKKHQLSPLRCDPLTERAALLHSKEMCKDRYFSHTSPRHGSANSRLNQAGVVFHSYGENIAAGGNTVTHFVQEKWMNSSGHRKNILSPLWTHLGSGFVACKEGEYPKYLTALFIKKPDP